MSHIVLFHVFFLAFATVSGQETRISGRITDAVTGEPVPYVNIYVKESMIGVISDLNGQYTLRTTAPVDSLHASFMGYIPISMPVKSGTAQVINFSLAAATTTLLEVEVIPEERWIELLMRRVIRSKDDNNPDKIPAYECEVYTKLQIDLNNVNERMKERRIFRPIDFVFENLDTSALNQKVFLPALLSETMSDFYFRKNPRATREYIKASRISGIENQSLTQYLGGMFLNVNIYDNYINIFDKNFVSPVANFGFSTYEYTLEDTVVIDGMTCYQVGFEPKRKHELTLYGRLWIHDSSFGVKKAEMRISPDANFNWINDFYISLTYDKVSGKYWALSRDYRLVDMNPFESANMKAMGLFGHKTTTYQDYIFDQPRADEFYSTPTNVIVENDAYQRDEEYWQAERHDTLTSQESGIYTMIDSVKNAPVYKVYEKIGYLVGTGYYLAGKFEIGPLYKFLSFNAVEGVRFRVGGRTSNDFSKRLMFEGHLAYGTLDQKLKYGLGMKYMLMKNPRRSVGFNFKYDMEQLGEYYNAFSQDNFFASFFRRSPADKLTMVREYNGFYEHEWFNGFSNTLRFIRRDVYAIGDDKFIINTPEGQYIDESLVSNEIQLYTRFAYREKFLYGEFERTSLGTKYPILELMYGYGIPGFAGSDVNYHRLQFKVKQWFNVFNIGWSKYILETGKIWGTLPYPFLKIHEGNETFFFYPEAGNMVNYYEFISDAYVSMYYTHHFDGLFLNRIPLMRKLKWREVVHGRAVYGTLTDANTAYSEFPDNSSELGKPYYEAGVGIENIFKVGRIDAIWRLSHLDKPDADRFRIFISFQFSF